HPCVARRAGTVDFLFARRGFLLHSGCAGQPSVAATRTAAAPGRHRGSATSSAARAAGQPVTDADPGRICATAAASATTPGCRPRPNPPTAAATPGAGRDSDAFAVITVADPGGAG